MKALANSAKKLLGITLSPEQLQKIQVYEDELLEWNERISLTAIRDVDAIRTKHFLNSLTLLLAWDRQGPPARIIDVGTGAGFPGLILKMLWPSAQVTLVESVHKKADFCQHIVDRLNLQQVTWSQSVPRRSVRTRRIGNPTTWL